MTAPDSLEAVIREMREQADETEWVPETRALEKFASRLEALRSAAPAGYAIVPVEPTAEMIEAGYKQYCVADKRGYSAWDDHLSVYRAMLAAAPPVKGREG